MKIKKITLILFLGFLCSKGLFAQFYQEDFANEFPADWTSIEVVGNGSSTASWTHTTSGPGAPIDFMIAPIASTTASNGWVMFDSNANCSGTTGQNAWLISPEIDATNIELVWLQFETYYRTFYDRPQLRIGTDMNNLDTWETIEIFPDVEVTDYAPINDASINAQLVNLDLTEYTANSVFRFAFQFLSDQTVFNGGEPVGCAYAWEIDDIALLDYNPNPSVDLQINPFYAIAPNAITPKSQVSPIAFMADIKNVGINDIDSSTLDINIFNGVGNILFSDQLNYSTILSGQVKENVFFSNQFTPPTSPDIYQGSYFANAIGSPDENLMNNEKSFLFEINDTMFSKSNTVTNGVSSNPDESTAFTYGNIYYIPNGEGMFARYVQFGVLNADELEGEIVEIYLYRWNGDLDNNGSIDPYEINSDSGAALFQSVTQYEFDGTENGELLTIPINIDGIGVPLADDSYYFVCVQYSGSEELFLLASNEHDYNSMRFITESLGMPRYAAAFDQGNTGIYDIVQNVVPVINMSIGNVQDIFEDPLANKEVLLPEHSIHIFPNPVGEIATIAFDLEATSINVEMDLFNSIGKLVKTVQYSNVKKDNLMMNVKNLVNGNYILKIHTTLGNSVIKMTILH